MVSEETLCCCSLEECGHQIEFIEWLICLISRQIIAEDVVLFALFFSKCLAYPGQDTVI